MAQDVALSRRKQGFESPRECHITIGIDVSGLYKPILRIPLLCSPFSSIDFDVTFSRAAILSSLTGK